MRPWKAAGRLLASPIGLATGTVMRVVQGAWTTGLPSATHTLAGITGFSTTQALLQVESQHSLAAVADLIATPGGGAWKNSANLASASIAGGLIQLDHNDTTSDDWWGSTVTAPLYAWEIERPPDQALYVETHVACPRPADASNYNHGGIMVLDGTNDQMWARWSIARVTSRILGARRSPTTTVGSDLTGQSEAQWSTGYWLQIVVDTRGDVHFYRRSAAAGARPAASTYTYHGSVGSQHLTSPRLRVGLLNSRPAPATVGIQFDHAAIYIRGGQLVTVG